MPSEYSVSATFNVFDLSPFDVGDDLKANHSQEERNERAQLTNGVWIQSKFQLGQS